MFFVHKSWHQYNFTPLNEIFCGYVAADPEKPIADEEGSVAATVKSQSSIGSKASGHLKSRSSQSKITTKPKVC